MADGIFEQRLLKLQQEATAASPAKKSPPPARTPRQSTPTEPFPAIAQPEPDSEASPGKAGAALRFALGGLWLFGTIKLAQSLPDIQARIAGAPALEAQGDMLMMALVLLVAASMVAFAWKIGRTVLRLWRRDAGWAVSLGAIAGLVLGVGPAQVLQIALSGSGF
ncbi:hypothetical protein [Tropicimonas marinistellae]|uniref:hypothetical protein n=1 Tax=Tropicimonas marinistellae TaxID=1739787 RepID=UPI0008330B6F|nr:hypothetical protein [Tropicimonas marinistellae]